jgi:DNA-directed RNA polymerase subunit RPC12/RpoP
MKLRLLHNNFLILIPPFIAMILLVVALWDFITDQQFILPILALYAILFILTIVFLFLRINAQPLGNNAVKLFEKSLKSSLHHFKCPHCSALFALKKSKIDNRKPFILYCPSCNTRGLISSKSTVIMERIPQVKSPRTKYQCTKCLEWITIWSEGSILQPKTEILSCPYCGSSKPLTQMLA